MPKPPGSPPRIADSAMPVRRSHRRRRRFVMFRSLQSSMKLRPLTLLLLPSRFTCQGLMRRSALDPGLNFTKNVGLGRDRLARGLTTGILVDRSYFTENIALTCNGLPYPATLGIGDDRPCFTEHVRGTSGDLSNRMPSIIFNDGPDFARKIGLWGHDRLDGSSLRVQHPASGLTQHIRFLSDDGGRFDRT